MTPVEPFYSKEFGYKLQRDAFNTNYIPSVKSVCSFVDDIGAMSTESSYLIQNLSFNTADQ